MYTVEQIKQHARTCTVYDDQHQKGGRGFIHLFHGQTIVCSYSMQRDSYTWFVQGECTREGEVKTLLKQQ